MADASDVERTDGDDEGRRRRLIANERRLRRINSRIEELNRVALMVDDEEDAEQARFLCECSRLDCGERLDLDVEEYAEVHAGGERFVLAPGHELEVDRVLERREGCVVVCKI